MFGNKAVVEGGRWKLGGAHDQNIFDDRTLHVCCLQSRAAGLYLGTVIPITGAFHLPSDSLNLLFI